MAQDENEQYGKCFKCFRGFAIFLNVILLLIAIGMIALGSLLFTDIFNKKIKENLQHYEAPGNSYQRRTGHGVLGGHGVRSGWSGKVLLEPAILYDSLPWGLAATG
jgi:hypothetical protein